MTQSGLGKHGDGVVRAVAVLTWCCLLRFRWESCGIALEALLTPCRTPAGGVH